MKAKYVVITAALIFSSVFSFVYMKFFSTYNTSITIYVCQVGIYGEEENVNAMKEKLATLEIESYTYIKDEQYYVITELFLDKDAANTIGTKISENEMTCVIKEYTMAEKFKNDIEKKEYEEILKELAKK